MAVVVIGIGEMGGVFARGLLKAGRPVVPVLRTTDTARIAAEVPDPELVLVAVGEADLDDTLGTLPARWRFRAGLLQNELLPRSWERHGLDDPTVIAVWFEKKPGREVKVILPSPVFGPGAALLGEALRLVDIPTVAVSAGAEGTTTLVQKNVYILVSNIAGLIVGGTVGALWSQHRDLATAVAEDVIDIQQALTGLELSRPLLLDHMAGAFAADPDHGCTGRSAPARLARALRHADDAGLAVATLRDIAGKTDGSVAT